MKAIVVGPSRGMVEAFENQGADVTVVEDVAIRDVLEEAGIVEADALILTDVREASAIPVARKLNDDIRVVIYDHQTMPDFVRAQVDLAVDPDLLDPETVAEELVDD